VLFAVGEVIPHLVICLLTFGALYRFHPFFNSLLREVKHTKLDTKVLIFSYHPDLPILPPTSYRSRFVHSIELLLQRENQIEVSKAL